MPRQVTISTQIPEEVKEWIRADADEQEITLSEWLNQLIQVYIADGFDDLTFEDIDDMSLDELAELIDEYDLDVDPEDHTNFFGNTSREKLRNAICDELEIEEDPEEE